MGKTEEQTMPWRERKKEIRHNWLRPFIFVEWLCERLSNLLGRWAFLDILGHAGRLTILIAVIFYFLEAEERKNQAENQRKAKQYQAWQVINAAHGKPGSGGRIDALQDLNKDKISLAGVDVSQAYLGGINIENADLVDANLSGAKLKYANLSGANLRIADLSGALIDLSDLSGTKLLNANLSEASLSYTNLSGVNLYGANLSGACFIRVDLSGAYLREVKGWQKIRAIRESNIYGIKSPPKGFVEWATAPEQGAVMIKNKDEYLAIVEKGLTDDLISELRRRVFLRK